MNYAYEFTKRALAQFQRLDSWLAEEVLDELELLTHQPPAPRPRSPAGAVYDFVRIRGDNVCYVFLTIRPIRARQVLRVTSVGVHIRHI